MAFRVTSERLTDLNPLLSSSIYHKGLPCTNHAHKRHVVSPSKLIEGSISIDQSKTAAYTLKALELEAAKPSFDELDLEVLADASLLLCNMFRYGKIRPRDAARITGSLRELGVSPTTTTPRKSISFLHPLLEDPSAPHPLSAWTRGGHVATVLIERLEAPLRDRGITWATRETEDTLDVQADQATLDDPTIEKLECSLVCLYYITALVKGVQEGPDAVRDSIQAWRRLLSCHSTLQDLHCRNHKPKGNKNGGPPSRQSSGGATSSIIESLVNKAEKRLQLLTTAAREQRVQSPSSTATITTSPRYPSPRDILLRHDTGEYSGSSSLLSPTSESSINFDPVNMDCVKDSDSPTSLAQASEKSVESLCSCTLPTPLSSKSLQSPPSPVQRIQTPQKKRAAKFAIHDSPGSIRSTLPMHREAQTDSPKRHTLNNKKSVPASLFRGFQNSSRSNLRQSLAGQSMSSSHLSLADMASSVSSSIAPSTTRMRYGDLRRPLLDRKPSQLSLAASSSTFGRRAWNTSSSTAAPISRISNLSSASLHTLAPTTDRQLAKTDVSSLPHAQVQTKAQSGAAHYLSSLRSSTSSSSSQRPTTSHLYTGGFRNALSSLSSFFTPSHLPTQVEEQSKAQAQLSKVVDQHNAELENFICWEDDRTSSEEESLHSGSPSDKAHDDNDSNHAINGLDAEDSKDQYRPSFAGQGVHYEESPRLSRLAKHSDSTHQRPVYPLSTSISSSYLHSSSPTSSPHRARTPSFQRDALSAATPTKSALKHSTTGPNPSAAHQVGESDGTVPPQQSTPSKSKSTKIDPLLAALEAASRVNVKSKCAVCGIQGINFPKCHRCGMTFCSRDCRMASGGDAGKHICQEQTTETTS